MTDPDWLGSDTPAERAALKVHLVEIERRGFSALGHRLVAVRSGVGRSAVVTAVATAWARGHLVVTPCQGEPSIIRLPGGRGFKSSEPT